MTPGIDLEGDGFVMQAMCGDRWRSLYAFDLQEQVLADYEVVNWYLCNSKRRFE